MNLPVPKNARISQLAGKLLAFQKLCSIKFVRYTVILYEKVMEMWGSNSEF
jgi:hypothetical protein